VAPRRLALGGAALLLSVVAPANALAAPAVSAKTPCIRYIGTNPPAPTLGVTATGWTAVAPLTFSLGSQAVGTATTDAAGTFDTGNAQFTPPEPKGNLQTMTLTAADGAGGTATSKVQVVRLIVTVPGGRHMPSAKVKYRAFGFVPHKKLYLFVRRGNKTKGRFVLGKPKGACGLLTTRMRFMPLKQYSAGVYEFWFSHSKTYSKATRIYSYKIQITKS
jgi:hypothetical protein